MEHQEIRFRILHTLYQKHYSDQLGHLQQTEKIIEESRLSDASKADKHGDVVYLEGKGLIKGQSALGYAYPPWITITSNGIDVVENTVNTFIRSVESIEYIPPNVKNDIKRVSNEQSTSAKIGVLVGFLDRLPDLDRLHLLAPLIDEFAKIVSGYR